MMGPLCRYALFIVMPDNADLTPVDLIIIHGVLITMDKERQIFSDGAVVISSGRILAVGKSSDLESAYTTKREIDAQGGVVQPGFIDCHVHASLHLGRSTIPDTWPVEREHDQWLPYWTNITEEEIHQSALLACMEMVHNGTTTFCDQSGRYHAEIAAEAVNKTGLKGVLTEACWDRHPHPAVAIGDTEECIARLERLLTALPKNAGNRTWAAVGLAGMGMCSDTLMIEGKKLADQYGTILTMHQSFGPADVARFKNQTRGRSAVGYLEEQGVLGSNLQLVHMIHADDSEAAILERTKTNVVHCPSASTRAGMGVSHHGKFPEMVERGINIALGSDAGTYSDFLDVGRQAYLAATIHKEAKASLPAISAHQALEMATLNGAKSLGIDYETGSLEVGKKADIVIHSRDRPEWHPGLDPVNTLIFSAQSTGVESVLVDGEVILEKGRLTGVDEEREFANIDRAARRLFERIDFHPEHPWPVVP